MRNVDARRVSSGHAVRSRRGARPWPVAFFVLARAPVAAPALFIAEAPVPRQRPRRVEAAFTHRAGERAVRQREWPQVAAAVAATARRAEGLRAVRTCPFAGALFELAIAPATAPAAGVAEALVASQRADRGERAPTVRADEPGRGSHGSHGVVTRGRADEPGGGSHGVTWGHMGSHGVGQTNLGEGATPFDDM